ncbi:FAD-dependent monooxygenase [Streptomyces triticisoli]|jgi:salicylate hydroxylase|uniref:FAD-dependent monooxygenase n=1 Tax=Streptomyces triticisoli TaxID=2182797 RepID=UPI001300B04C|nr:FAD-dependent monooxygenase [Streptomyces triticisoli]
MSHTSAQLDVIIAGAGIGGLATALALRQHGHRVRIYERATELTEVGAGLQVSPNSTRVLDSLGLGSGLARTGVRPVRLESRDWQDGRLLGVHAMNTDPPQYGAYHYLIHRAELLDILTEAVPSQLVHLGRAVTDVVRNDDRVTVRLSDGETVSGDLLIGADGIHSTVSTVMFGTSRPRFSGTVAYRALLPAHEAEDLKLENTSTKWWGPVVEHHLVHYFVNSGSTVNIIAVVPEDDWQTESWTAQGEPDDLANAFKDYAWPIPDLVKRAGTPLKWALHERDPLQRWCTGRVALLGDACHPMVPFLAQGSAMAIEDAAVLARCLDQVSRVGVERALQTYEATRKARTSRIQQGARVDTPETWKLRDWIYEYDATSTPLIDPTNTLSTITDGDTAT